MKVYNVGEKSRAICHHCKASVSTTYKYRDVPFDDGNGKVKDVLSSVCDQCDSVVALPAQSAPAVRNARKIADIPLEIQLPVSDMELIDLAIFRIDYELGRRLRKPLFVYYINQLSKDPSAAELLKCYASTCAFDLKEVPKRRLSMKLAPKTNNLIQKLIKVSGLKKTTLFRSIVYQINQDLVVPEEPSNLERLKEIASVVGA